MVEAMGDVGFSTLKILATVKHASTDGYLYTVLVPLRF